MASSGLYLSLDKQFWPWDWAWVQSAQGSYQLGKTVKMTTFMGLAAILMHYLKTICKYEIFS